MLPQSGRNGGTSLSGYRYPNRYNVGETLRRLLLQVCLPFAERGKRIHSRAM